MRETPVARPSSAAAAGRRLSGRTFQALANYNFRLFASVQVVSQSGIWLQRTAQAWLVLDMTASPVALGVVSALQTLPISVLSLFGGVPADRVPKRTFLIWILIAETLQAAVLAYLVLSSQIQLWEVDLLALVLGTLTALESPTRQSFVSEMVPAEQIQSAISRRASGTCWRPGPASRSCSCCSRSAACTCSRSRSWSCSGC